LQHESNTVMDSPTTTTPFLTSSESTNKDDGEAATDSTPYYQDSELNSDHLLPSPATKSHHITTQKPHRRILTTLLNLTTYFLSLYAIFSLFYPILYHPPTPDTYRPSTLPLNLSHCLCPPSLSASLNCTYDPLATAWLPPHCRDPLLTTEFNRSGPGPNGTWIYFADRNGTIPIPLSDLGNRKTFWASTEWHAAHCGFYWMKYVRMRETGAVMEERFEGVRHVRHCMGLMRRFRKLGEGRLIEVPVMKDSSLRAHLEAARFLEGGHGKGGGGGDMGME
jgi:hypothetical protein